MEIAIKNKKYRLTPGMAIGKGGEADVYKIDKNKALKIFKTPKHPDLSGQKEEQQKANSRIVEQQKKLPKFPNLKYDRIISPLDMAFRGKKIAGYTMNLVKNAEPIMMYSKKGFRLQGASDEQVMKIFQDMHGTLRMIHKSGLIIGDYNDLNILVKDEKAYFIDVDSWQYGGFYCHAFTAKFLDPLFADSRAKHFILAKPFDSEADWYAYAVMYFQSLLFVDPYGGVYRPSNKKNRLNEGQRPLKRITVFHNEVRYPKPARTLEVLPDDLLHYFEEVFVRDKREIFPESYLKLEWKKCPKCKQIYARANCPNCKSAAREAVKETIIIRGKIKARPIVKTNGQILFASWSNGLQWLVYEDGRYLREGKKKILTGSLIPGIRYRIQGDNTILGQGRQLVIINKKEEVKKITIDSLNNLSIFDANDNNIFYLQNGMLYRLDEWVPLRIGEALADQTLFWTGEKIGFGFYRAGMLSEAFVFNPNRVGLVYVKNFVFPPGKLIDSTCFFSDNLIWFFISMMDKGKAINYSYLYNFKGELISKASNAGENNVWLNEIRGKIALGNFLLSATDDGIVRIENNQGRLIEVRNFPDTEAFTQSDSHILAGDNGLYIIGGKQINHIELI